MQPHAGCEVKYCFAITYLASNLFCLEAQKCVKLRKMYLTELQDKEEEEYHKRSHMHPMIETRRLKHSNRKLEDLTYAKT